MSAGGSSRSACLMFGPEFVARSLPLTARNDPGGAVHAEARVSNQQSAQLQVSNRKLCAAVLGLGYVDAPAATDVFDLTAGDGDRLADCPRS